jgi:hypothetical protein
MCVFGIKVCIFISSRLHQAMENKDDLIRALSSLPSDIAFPDELGKLCGQAVQVFASSFIHSPVVIANGGRNLCGLKVCMAQVFYKVAVALDVSVEPGLKAKSFSKASALLNESSLVWSELVWPESQEHWSFSSCSLINTCFASFKAVIESAKSTLHTEVCTSLDSALLTACDLMKVAPLASVIEEHETFQAIAHAALPLWLPPNNQVREFVGAHNKVRQLFDTYTSVCTELGETVRDDVLRPLTSLRICFDSITALQVLTRPLKPGEELPKLCALAYKLVKPARLSVVLRSALEFKIPASTLASLKASMELDAQASTS